MVQSTAKVFLVSFDIPDNSYRLFCDVQCSVKRGFSYPLLFFTDKRLPGLLQFSEMKLQNEQYTIEAADTQVDSRPGGRFWAGSNESLLIDP